MILALMQKTIRRLTSVMSYFKTHTLMEKLWNYFGFLSQNLPKIFSHLCYEDKYRPMTSNVRAVEGKTFNSKTPNHVGAVQRLGWLFRLVSTQIKEGGTLLKDTMNLLLDGKCITSSNWLYQGWVHYFMLYEFLLWRSTSLALKWPSETNQSYYIAYKSLLEYLRKSIHITGKPSLHLLNVHIVFFVCFFK